ncbi:MAG: hypothetical protein JXB47_17770 [Anaerolineae bacterium]|nr:hypothetical protein [Anaerolineae bacterium]
MRDKIKYPLTESAKEGARQLVENWDSGKILQCTSIKLSTTSKRDIAQDLVRMSWDTLSEWGYLEAPILFELAKYGLVDIETQYVNDGKVTVTRVLLLQELRNAVENDFEVSDYFLTMNAVGTVVGGDLIVHSGATYQSLGSGTAYQNVEQVADDLERTLGVDFLQNQIELKSAIQELRNTVNQPKETRLAKMGKVVQQLGACLEHSANAVAVIAALPAAVEFLTRLMGG